jgi:hypothetical protein
MVLYTLLLHTCTTGTIGICTIDFKITYIVDTSTIFMFVATIEIMQSTTKSWYVVNFLMLYFVHCFKSFRSKLGWWFGTFYSQIVVFYEVECNMGQRHWLSTCNWLEKIISSTSQSNLYLYRPDSQLIQSHIRPTDNYQNLENPRTYNATESIVKLLPGCMWTKSVPIHYESTICHKFVLVRSSVSDDSDYIDRLSWLLELINAQQ